LQSPKQSMQITAVEGQMVLIDNLFTINHSRLVLTVSFKHRR
jgi:hypothetical protein